MGRCDWGTNLTGTLIQDEVETKNTKMHHQVQQVLYEHRKSLWSLFYEHKMHKMQALPNIIPSLVLYCFPHGNHCPEYCFWMNGDWTFWTGFWYFFLKNLSKCILKAWIKDVRVHKRSCFARKMWRAIRSAESGLNENWVRSSVCVCVLRGTGGC